MQAELVSGAETAGAVPGGSVAWVRVFEGRRDQVRAARAWVLGVAASVGADPEEASLFTSELAANAVVHTRSGLPGGHLAVAVTAEDCAVVLHVHDEGTAGMPGPGHRPGADSGVLAESGRGLVLVGGLSAASGHGPADRCGAAPGTPGGRCTWVQLAKPLAGPAPVPVAGDAS